MKPRVLVVADVPQWAWGRKAGAYAQHLGDRFDVRIAFQAAGPPVPPFEDFDLVHLFEVSQVAIFAERWPAVVRPWKAVAGLTAHVWPTWGADRMHAWATRVDALHGNSVLLAAELRQFHERVYYTPNGVDADFFAPNWRLDSDRPSRLIPSPSGSNVVFGHVGKPNARKGGAVIVEAAKRAGVELRAVVRTSKMALTPAQMRDWYQGVDVMVCASNMDGTPGPMLEGAACEAALLSTKIGNMPQFIEPGVNGFLTEEALPMASDGEENRRRGLLPPEMTKALACELAERMAWFSEHPRETRDMGRAARRTVLAGWTWERQVELVAKMWDEVLGG